MIIRTARTTLLAVALSLGVISTPRAATTAEPTTPAKVREVIPFNQDWRFHKDAAADEADGLIYDVRPKVTDDQDDKAADTMPQEAEALRAAGRPVLKPWILPSGNRFIKDPAKRYQRPAGDPGANYPYVQAQFDDHTWQRVNLPHDWAITGPFLVTGNYGGMGRLPSWGVAWYRKQFTAPASDADKRVFLDVDGAMSYAMVWLNGHLVGGWPYGYSSWRLDLTPYLKVNGVNQLAIRLDNPPSSSRWYPGGGLYRNVWLTKTDPVHVGQWGTQITTRDVSAATATVDVSVTVDNDTTTAAAVVVATQLFALDASGHVTGPVVAEASAPEAAVPAGDRQTVTSTVAVTHPRLWGPPPTQVPNRYLAITTVRRDGRVIDQYETPFGIRAVRFDANNGILVNGERIPIRGVNNHHDLGALGAAFNVRAAERQLELLRDMGCNAIRMSHNPPAPEMLELTDAMGFLVMDESFDCWRRKKTPLDFHLIYPEWHEQDMRALVRRDRNHPSVILWSVGNEVGEQYTGAAGGAVARELCAIVHEEDPTRPTTSAMNFAKPDMALPAAVDVISLNYQGEGIRDTPEFEHTDRIRTPPMYPAFHQKFPEKVVLSSETASAFSSRGIYLFPVSPELSAPVRDGRGGDSKIAQVTAYELHAVDFGASADKVFGKIAQHPYVAGEFVWTGFDYLGEPTPYYSARSSYSGILDLAGFKKDRFWLYQAHWRPDYPMAHILPHWTWPERVGQVTPVHVFTSGDAAELFLNGKSLGRKTKGPDEYRLRWDDVVYEPGTLQVIAYKNGQRWAEETVRTARAAAALTAEPDRAEIRADGLDLSFVTVRVTDPEGTTVPRATNPITFRLEGPGDIIATDNGDPTSFEPFQAPVRHAFSGLCLAVIRSRPNQPGTLRLTATSDGLKPTTVRITSR